MLRSFRRSPVSLPDALSATIWVGRRFFQRRKMRQVPIWTGDIVEVEYCTVEDYYPNYRILKQKLMTEFADLIEVRGNPYGMPRRSAFEVLWRCETVTPDLLDGNHRYTAGVERIYRKSYGRNIPQANLRRRMRLMVWLRSSSTICSRF